MGRCPCCGSELFCDCPSCREDHKDKNKWYMSENGFVMCGVCGFRWNVNEAMDHDWELYRGEK